MPVETERKFLVKNDTFKNQGKSFHIRQGFLNTDKERVVRIRIMGELAFLTIKGISKGASRAEFEYAIPLEDAAFMLDNLCLHPIIEKHRYIIRFGGFKWEVDEFHGENEGLIIAEIELPAEDTAFPFRNGSEMKSQMIPGTIIPTW